MADAASYMCVAENPAGSAEKLFTLRVQGELGQAGSPQGSPAEEELCMLHELTVQADTAPGPSQTGTTPVLPPVPRPRLQGCT